MAYGVCLYDSGYGTTERAYYFFPPQLDWVQLILFGRLIHSFL